MKPKKVIQLLAAVLLVGFAAGCKKDSDNGIPPTVLSTDATNKPTPAGIDSKISVTFSTAMDPSSITAATFIVKQGIAPVTGTVEYSGVTATFTPAAYLAPNTIYTAAITTGAKDVSGKSLAKDYVWSVTTSSIPDTTSPTVTLSDPANNAVDIRIEAIGPNSHPIIVTFSEPMDAATITATTFTLKKGSTPVLGSITNTSTTATFRPAGNLVSSTIYTATITTAATDTAGNALASNFTVSFTTSGPPIVVSTNPVSLGTCVDITKAITVTFSEAMDCLTITGVTFTVVVGMPSGKIPEVVAGTVTCEGTTATFTPSSPLLPNTIYTVIISGVQSQAGSPMPNDFVWTFTTLAPSCQGRTIKPEDRDQLIALLVQAAGPDRPTIDFYAVLDPEALSFKDQLKELFIEANWIVQADEIWPEHNPPASGILLLTNFEDDGVQDRGQFVADALGLIGYQFSAPNAPLVQDHYIIRIFHKE